MMLRFQPTAPARNDVLREAFDALDRAGIEHAFRKGAGNVDPYEPGSEIDIFLHREDIRTADDVLRNAGFHRLAAPGHPQHRFYVAFDGGRWLKIDAKIVHHGSNLPLFGRPGRAADHLLSGLARRRPVHWRRMGPVVAMLGPDGAGKGTVINALIQRIPIGLTTIYLGERRNSPTPPSPRGGGKSNAMSSRKGQGDAKRVSAFRECAFVLYRWLRFWSILFRGYAIAWAGHIVICDRHPIEALAIRPRTTRIAGALEAFLFGRLMPWPDALLVLDAPGDLLFARKRENDPLSLERQRQCYRETFVPAGAHLISSVDQAETTIDAASLVVWNALKERRGW